MSAKPRSRLPYALEGACTYCGEKQLAITGSAKKPILFQVECSGCGAYGPSADKPSDALMRWEGAHNPLRQHRVADWVAEALGHDALHDAAERALRTVEETIELAQVCGVEASTLHRLVDYVLARPIGEAAQEIGGSLLTLYSTAEALGIDADAAFETELERAQRPEVMERVRRRQLEKREALVGDLKG